MSDAAVDSPDRENNGGRKWLKWLAIPLLILIFFVVSLVLILRSDAFSLWVVEKVDTLVPNLTLSDAKGNFFQGLELNVAYEEPSIQINIDAASLQVRIACLWRMQLCVDRLSVKHLSIDLLSVDDAPPAEPAESFPAIELPLPLRLEKLTINKFEIQTDGAQVYHLNDINTGLSWSGNSLRWRTLTAADDYCTYTLDGRITFQQFYPIDTHVKCQLNEALLQVAGEAQGTIKGELDALGFDLQSSLLPTALTQAFPITLSGNINVLDGTLPLTANLALQNATSVNLGEEEIRITTADVELRGTLFNAHIDVVSTIANPWTPSPVDIALNSIVDATDFKRVAIVVESLTTQFDSEISKQRNQQRNQERNQKRPEVKAAGTLSLSEAITWNGDLQWRFVDFSHWQLQDLTDFTGNATTSIQFQNNVLNANVDITKSDGQFLGQPLSMATKLNLKGDAIAIENLRLKHGNKNEITSNGKIQGSQLQLHADIALSDLNNPWYVLEGALVGKVDIAGTIESPIITSQLKATSINSDAFSFAEGNVVVDVNNIRAGNNKLILQVKDFSTTNQLIGTGSVTLQGNLADNATDIQWENAAVAEAKTQLRCEGALQVGNQWYNAKQWQGDCLSWDLNYHLAETSHQWRLENRFNVAVAFTPFAVDVGAFCLKNTEASFCSRESFAFVQGDIPRLSIAGNRLPIDWFEPYLTPGVNAVGRWSFDANATNLLSEPKLNGTIDASRSELRWVRNEKQFAKLQFTQVTATASWENQRQRISLKMVTENSGRVDADAFLTNKNVEGDVSLNAIKLNTFSRLFLPNPNDSLAGSLNGKLALNGSLQKPDVQGELILSKGQLNTQLLPTSIDNIEMTIETANNQLNLQGRFAANNQPGQLTGKINFTESALTGELGLKAARIDLQPLPEMVLSVAPDLSLTLNNQKLLLTGSVKIPEADIQIEALPASAISESSDAVIIGAEKSGQQAVVSSDIEVVLGEKVHLGAFGLETGLTGKLRLKQEANGPLRGNGVVQLKDGSYKAYGQNLRIREGDLVFVDVLENPQIRVTAVRDDLPENITVGLRAVGPAQSPTFSLFSEPSMSLQEQQSYLITGRAPGTSSGTDPNLAAAEAAFNYALESDLGLGVTQKAGQALGIEELKISSQSGENGAQIGISGYLSPNLLVRYGVGVFDTANTLTLNYRLRKNLYIEVLTGERSAVDLLWSFEKD